LYVLMAGVITGMRKYTTYLGDPAAVATAFADRPWATALISAGALAGITSVLLVFQLAQPRIFMAMARDGLLPQYFAKIHPRFRTPHITTIWTGVAVGGVAMLADIGSLADLTNIGTLFAFVLVCLGVIVLRRTNRERPACSLRAGLSASRCGLLLRADAKLAARDVGPLLYLVCHRALDLLRL